MSTGKDKRSFAKTHKLLTSPLGTLSAKILDVCPVPSCEKDLARYTTKEHVPGCIETAVQEVPAVKYALLLVARGCPVFGCKSKWNVRGGKEKDVARSWKDHVRQRKDWYNFCGLVKADGSECKWSPSESSTSHHESLDVALLESHREHAHALPARPTVSCSFNKEVWVCLVGQLELQRYWAAKCPSEGDTLVSTKARWNGQEHCPVCLLDEHLAPNKRMETSKAAAQHLFTSHLSLDEYKPEHAWIRCPCCADVVSLWTLFEHLDAAGVHVLSAKDKTDKDPWERPRALSRGPLPPARYHRPQFSSANHGVYRKQGIRRARRRRRAQRTEELNRIDVDLPYNVSLSLIRLYS